MALTNAERQARWRKKHLALASGVEAAFELGRQQAIMDLLLPIEFEMQDDKIVGRLSLEMCADLNGVSIADAKLYISLAMNSALLGCLPQKLDA